jgi:hypothetical protein
MELRPCVLRKFLRFMRVSRRLRRHRFHIDYLHFLLSRHEHLIQVTTVHGRRAVYNPMSYLNGLVWPQDDALIASGLSRHGFKSVALRHDVGLTVLRRTGDVTVVHVT